jgi:hypothetical protein
VSPSDSSLDRLPTYEESACAIAERRRRRRAMRAPGLTMK